MKLKLSGKSIQRGLASAQSYKLHSDGVILALLVLSVTSATAKAEILTGSTVFDFTPNPSVSLNLSIDSSTSLVDIFLSGRSDGWFGIGFGRQDMDGTYAIVVDQSGTTSEYRLANFGFGNALLSNSLSVISSTVLGSTRSVQVQRPRDLGVGFPDHYVFPMLAGDLDIAGATGAGAFGFHSDRDGRSIPLSATAVPEPASGFLAICGLTGLLYLRGFRNRRLPSF